jgi:hypothetical protein
LLRHIFVAAVSEKTLIFCGRFAAPRGILLARKPRRGRRHLSYKSRYSGSLPRITASTGETPVSHREISKHAGI